MNEYYSARSVLQQFSKHVLESVGQQDQVKAAMDNNAPAQASCNVPKLPAPPVENLAAAPRPRLGPSRIPSPSRGRIAHSDKSPSTGSSSILRCATQTQDAGQTTCQGACQLQPQPAGQLKTPIIPRMDFSKLQISSTGAMSTPSKDPQLGHPAPSLSPEVTPKTTVIADSGSGQGCVSRIGKGSPANAKLMKSHGSPSVLKQQRGPMRVASPASTGKPLHVARPSASVRPRSAYAGVVSSPANVRIGTAAAGSPAAKMRPASAGPRGSPSPGFSKTTAVRLVDARHAGSADKSKLNGDTKASILRRSASVDKMRSNSMQRPGPGCPVSAARVLSAGAHRTQAVPDMKQPHPPSQPRPTRTSIMRANPSPAGQKSPIKPKPLARSNPSPARHSLAESLKTSAKGVSSILSTIPERAKAAAAVPARFVYMGWFTLLLHGRPFCV